MLLELRLKNLAIAADVTLPLARGLNVLSGSTGAGKSLVVEALRWLSGARVDRSTVRRGASMASAEALVDLNDVTHANDLLEDVGLEWPEDGLLRLRREVLADAPSRAYVGASRTTAAVLTAVCRGLIELQSQHGHLRLLDPGQHTQLLDSCGVAGEVVTRYTRAHTAYRAAKERYQVWQQRLEQVREQRDLLAYQWRELEEAQLQGQEMNGLREKVGRLAGGAQLLAALGEADRHLEDDERGVIATLGRAVRALDSVQSDLDRLEDAREALRSAQASVSDAQAEIRSLLLDDSADPADLDRAQARLAHLESLTKKYGRTEAELVSFREQLQAELLQLDGDQGPPSEIAGPLRQTIEELEKAGTALDRARRSVARRVTKEARPLLDDLGMPGAQLSFELVPRIDEAGPVQVQGHAVDPGRNGLSDVRLQVRTNPGEAMGRIDRVASGGELSRIGLVLKAMATRADAALMILDEVDAGLGGDLGPAVARRLAAMASRTQLLVITHLPHVAAAARSHLRAHKVEIAGRTVSTVDRLDAAERVDELARMIGGDGPQATALAKELLNTAPESTEATS